MGVGTEGCTVTPLESGVAVWNAERRARCGMIDSALCYTKLVIDVISLDMKLNAIMIILGT